MFTLCTCCRSKIYIANHYREFDGLPEDMAEKQDTVMDTDEAQGVIVSPKPFDFTYGTSPGFKKWQDGPLSIDQSIEGVFPI